MKKGHWLIAAIAFTFIASSLYAQASGNTELLSDSTPIKLTMWGIIAKGGIIGYIILGMSVCAAALVIEHMITIRKNVLLPDDIADTVRDHVAKEELEQAIDVCEQNDNFLTRVLAFGLSQRNSIMGYYDIEKAVEEAARRESGRLYRKIEYLAFIANSAPMLGLLGTVTGMISAFNYIAALEGASRSTQLAGAISEALVTTCLGLIVAIPSLFFISMLRNRIDAIMTEAEILTESILSPLKERLKHNKTA